MRKHYMLAALLAGSLAFTACSSFLDEEPLGQQTDQNFYNTPGNAELGVNAIYHAYANDRQRALMFFFGDVASDDAEKGGEGPNDLIEMQELKEWRVKATADVIVDTWTRRYETIFRANRTIEGIQQAPFADDLKAPLLGEAAFLRALSYFDLVRIYGGVPLFDRTLGPSEYKRQRATPDQVYQQIEKDLKQAIAQLPARSKRSADQLGRSTKGAAQAMLARVIMQQGGNRWQEVYDLTQAVIASGEYRLTPNYADIFEMKGENNAESVFELQFGTSNTGWADANTGTAGPVYQGNRAMGWGWGFNNPSLSLLSEFEPGDVRMACAVYGEGDKVYGVVQKVDGGNVTGLLNRKVALEKGLIPNEATDCPQNHRLMRYADVLLMHAEAAFFLGKEAEAREDVNTLRARARNSFLLEGNASTRLQDVAADKRLPALDASFTANKLRDAIWHERRVELAMEGHRLFDLIRQSKLDANRLKLLPGYNNMAVKEKPFLPIPLSEVQAWGLEQNPGQW